MPDQGAMRQLNGFCIDGHTLGEGFSGKVKRGVHLVSGETVALKCIKESHLRNPGARRLVDQEIRTMEALGEHPHIVSLLHADRNAVYPRKGNKGTRPVVLLALALCEGGELLHVLTETGALGETVARTYFHQLLSALGQC